MTHGNASRWARKRIFSGARERRALLFLVSLAVSLMGVLLMLVSAPHGRWLGQAAIAFFFPGVLVASLQAIKSLRRVERFQRTFVVRRSRSITLSYLVVSTGWLIGSLLVLINRPGTEWVALPLAYACALGIVVSFWLIADWRPTLVINDEGFFDRNLGRGIIPWSEIRGASIKNIGGTDVLCLKLKNRKSVLENRSWWQRVSAALNQLVSFELLHLGMVQMEAQYLDEALDFVLSRCAAEVKLPGDNDLAELLNFAAEVENTDSAEQTL